MVLHAAICRRELRIEIDGTHLYPGRGHRQRRLLADGPAAPWWPAVLMSGVAAPLCR